MRPELSAGRGPRLLLLLLLALAHLGLVAWLNSRPAPGRPVRQALSLLRLSDEKARTQPTRIQPAPAQAPRPPLPVAVPIEPPQFSISAFTPLTQAPSPEQTSAAAVARPAPLNLAPPAPQPAASAPAPWRNPALSDPRANTRRADYAARMADTLGTDQSLREESLGPGRHRFRQGTSCVETAESRIAQIDPMGATMRGSPQLMTTCK